MIEAYQNFFLASVGASAALIGLLFVALSFIDSEQVDQENRIWRRILATSAFSQLVAIFFVSMAGLLPQTESLAWTALVMAMLGILVAFMLLPKALTGSRPGRRSPTALGLIAVGAYAALIFAGIGIIKMPDSAGAWNFLIFGIFALYAGALARAWEIAGNKKS